MKQCNLIFRHLNFLEILQPLYPSSYKNSFKNTKFGLTFPALCMYFMNPILGKTVGLHLSAIRHDKEIETL